MGIELEASASIGVAIGDKLDKIGDLLGKEDPKPILLPVLGSRVGPGIILLGSPPVGRIWNIVTFTVLGVDDKTTSAGMTVALYVDSDEQNLGLGQCVIPGVAVPSLTTITKGTVWCQTNGGVVANVVGGSGNVSVRLGIQEWNVDDVMAAYIRG